MPNALVTGARGLVGSHIVDQLLRSGWTVRALLRTPNSQLEARGVATLRGDVLDAEGFARAAEGCDVLFHTAAAVVSSGGWETYRHLNVDGTSNAVAAAERSGARLLHLSSVAVYGSDARYEHGPARTDEDTLLAPLPTNAYYARSKRDSERIVLDAHAAGRIWATAVRPDVIYGPRDRQFVPRIAKLLRFGVAPVIGGGRSTLAVVHAANVADGAIRAATNSLAGGRAYNLANDFDITVREFLALACRGLGKTVRFLPIPLAVARAAFGAAVGAARIFSGGRGSVLSGASLAMVTLDNPFTSDRARRELGWAPVVTPEQGVPEAFRWWLHHH